MRKSGTAETHANLSTKFSILLTAMIAMIVLGIGPAAANAQTKNDSGPATLQSESVRIKAILADQTKAWNAGDLEKFMATYWKSDRLTFSSGGKTTSGWQATLDNYKKSYPTPERMGQLHFDKLDVSMIESNSALVLGHWHLKMKDGEKRDGNFSLVVKRFNQDWKIIHDHSSSLEPKQKPKDDVESNKDQ